jgi:hypothetical protein
LDGNSCYWLLLSCCVFLPDSPIFKHTHPILRYLNIPTLDFVYYYSDYLPYLSVVGLVASYLFGIIIFRFTDLFVSPLVNWLEEKIGRGRLLTTGNWADNRHAVHVKVLQYGSGRLHRELDFQFSTLAMLQQLTLSFPLACLSLANWIITTYAHEFSTPILAFALISEIIIVLAMIRQREGYLRLRNAADAEADNMRSHK